MFHFATCDRRRALKFLKKLYPTRTVEDTQASAGPLLDLVEKDIVRITDPDFHRGEVLPGTHWDEAKRDDIYQVCANFHSGATAAADSGSSAH